MSQRPAYRLARKRAMPGAAGAHKRGVNGVYAPFTRGGRLANGGVTGGRGKLGSCKEASMADLVYLGAGLAFFAAMALYAYACDRV
jgi:hypothetical protein